MFQCKIKTNIHDILGTKKLPTLILHSASSFLEDLCLYRYEILLEVSLKIILPILHGDLVCFNIFSKRVVTFVCLVSFYFFNGAIEIECLTTFQLHPYIFLSLDVVYILGKLKCKVLEIIPIDMEGERCEMIASVCLQLLFGVT
jgi:hypothetical protein